MKLLIIYRPSAVKQIKKLQKSDEKKVIRKLESLATDPYSGKPLKGEFAGLYSLRAWPYRIVYRIQKKSIVIYNVSHR